MKLLTSCPLAWAPFQRRPRDWKRYVAPSPLTATSEEKEGTNNSCVTKIEQSNFQLAHDDFVMRDIEDIENPEEVPSSSSVQDAAHTSAVIFDNTGVERTVRVAILMRAEDFEEVESIESASSVGAVPPITQVAPVTVIPAPCSYQT